MLVLLVLVMAVPVPPAAAVVIVVMIMTFRIHRAHRVTVVAPSLCLRCIGCSQEEHYQK